MYTHGSRAPSKQINVDVILVACRGQKYSVLTSNKTYNNDSPLSPLMDSIFRRSSGMVERDGIIIFMGTRIRVFLGEERNGDDTKSGARKKRREEREKEGRRERKEGRWRRRPPWSRITINTRLGRACTLARY